MNSKKDSAGMAETIYLKEDLKDDAKAYFGTTTIPKAAFYINTDGTLLDGSGFRLGAARKDRRTVDHREIANVMSNISGNEALIAYLKEGNIRWMPETFGIDLIKEPTESQYKTIATLLKNTNIDEFSIDFSNERGEVVDSLYYDFVRPSQIIMDIRKHFELKENLQPFELENEKDRIRDVLDIMKDVEYGFISKVDGKRITDRDWIHNCDLNKYYEVNTNPLKTLKDKLGICRDQSIAIKYLMNKFHPEDEVYLYALTTDIQGHCVPCYCHEGKWYYIENSWDKEKGLHGYFNTKEELENYLQYIYFKNHKEDNELNSLNDVDIKQLDEDISSFFKNLPKYFYHATYKPFLKSILEKGLGNTKRKMWSDSKGKGAVYLSLKPEVAYSYAEIAEWLDEVEDYDKYADNIIVLKIDSSKLDKDKIFVDENVLDNDGSTIEYYGIINKEAIVDIVDEQGKSINSRKLTEDTRNQLIAASRNAGLYRGDLTRGKNRFERKKYSKVAQTVKEFNNLDMNDLFKKDQLDVQVPVMGETKNYTVTIRINGVCAEIAKNIKNNGNIFEFKTVIQALTKVFNSGNVFIHCSCDDFKFRFDYWSVVNNYGTTDSAHNPGPGKGIANPNNDKGKGCKHCLLVISNGDWLMRVASVIRNYTLYIAEHRPQVFNKVIFPKLYGMPIDAASEEGLLPEDSKLWTNKNVIDIVNSYAKNKGKFKAGTNKNQAAGKGKLEVSAQNTENKVD